MIHLPIPAGFDTSQLDVNRVYRDSDKSVFFYAIIFVTGEDNKTVFSVPGNTVQEGVRPLGEKA
jgi:hypothetical protein